MKKILVLLTFFFLCARPAFAQEQSAPPHLVINFAQMNELDWAASESVWQSEIKPKVIAEILQMKSSLTPATQSDSTPVLSWSTLLEYMNFPMDTPSDQSVYAVKMRRILEIAEELNFPVYVPLNGYQWWDHLPELYNWWDEDGTKTDPNFFSRQKNPEEFKARFIAAFDPDNVKNVEWQSLRTPMKLGYRNWGGGGFRLAPPPNLLSPAFQRIQRDRLNVILAEITTKQTQWEKENKSHLFVGISIGTEISLNASITPADEFKPYGYRGMQDLGCQETPVSCRTQVLQKYLETTSQYVNRSGISKEKIYTHVYGETDPSDSHYALYAESAFNLYSNPGSSFYGHKDNPLGSAQWNAMIQKYNYPNWGAIEYSDTPTAAGLTRTLSQASLVDIYNWDSLQNNTTSKRAIVAALSTPMTTSTYSCQETKKHIQSGLTARLGNADVTAPERPHGIYVTFTESDCGRGKKIYSTPTVFYVPLPEAEDTTPKWVRWIIEVEKKLRKSRP